jgi:transcription elongation factor Elf1
MFICPKCGGREVDTFRSSVGPIWCKSCGLRASHKEEHNPFITTKLSSKENKIAEAMEVLAHLQKLLKELYDEC